MSHQPGTEASEERKERAAALVAEATHTNEDIARQVGCTRRTLQRWLNDDAFMARVGDFSGQIVSQVVTRGIADRQARLAALEDRWQRMQRIVNERAADPSMIGVPGGTTGFLIHTLKSIGAGPDAQVVDEYASDTGLLREMRAHEQQAAQETGQWDEKRTADDPVNVQLTTRLESMSDEELIRYVASLSTGDPQ